MKMGHSYLLTFLLTLLVTWSSAERPEFCNETPDHGGQDCGARFERRYFYNPGGDACVGFIYEGCGGNQNNFRTLEECQQTCALPAEDVCNMPPDEGFLCRSEHGSRRFFYSPAHGSCRKLSFYGCGGNPNNFPSEEACNKKCGVTPEKVCKMPLDTGSDRCHSDSTTTRFYFNAETDTCEEFQFTCDGNNNNFRTSDQCQHMCQRAQFYGIPEDSPCLTPLPEGHCRYVHWTYTFDSSTGACVMADLFACSHGNGNLFDLFGECMNTCNPSRKMVSRIRNSMGDMDRGDRVRNYHPPRDMEDRDRSYNSYNSYYNH